MHYIGGHICPLQLIAVPASIQKGGVLMKPPLSRDMAARGQFKNLYVMVSFLEVTLSIHVRLV